MFPRTCICKNLSVSGPFPEQSELNILLKITTRLWIPLAEGIRTKNGRLCELLIVISSGQVEGMIPSQASDDEMKASS